MLELTDNEVSRWGRHIGIGSLRLAEQDYRLVELVRSIARDDLLGPRLVFKGGTALNKLYFGEYARMSVDLDFNVLGTRDSVQAERAQVRGRLIDLFKEQDPSFTTTHDHSWQMLRVTGRYQPLAGGEPEKIKVEVSTVERFPITQPVARPLQMPDGSAEKVRTLPIDELVSTKVRALYGRRKGRDVFDLRRARPLLQHPTLIRKMAIYYFYRAKTVYDPDELRAAFADKARAATFKRDLETYLRADIAFDVDKVLSQLPVQYDFLFELDARDQEFILFAKHLLGKIGEKRAADVLDHDKPLARLMEGQPGVSETALNATREDIYVHLEK